MPDTPNTEKQSKCQVIYEVLVKRERKGEGVLICMYRYTRSRMTIEPRIPTTPARRGGVGGEAREGADLATVAGRALPASIVLMRVAGSRWEVPLACAFVSFWKYFCAWVLLVGPYQSPERRKGEGRRGGEGRRRREWGKRGGGSATGEKDPHESRTRNINKRDGRVCRAANEAGWGGVHICCLP